MTPHDTEQMKAKAEAGIVITQQEAHQALAEILQWRSIAEEFCRRVEAGEIRSTRTYEAMRAVLSGDAP